MKSRLTATFFCLALSGISQASLITNGDFEAGNTGFSSDYVYAPVTFSPNIQQYGVTTSTFA